MNTAIALTTKNGMLEVANYSIPFAAGDTVTFNADGGCAILCFASQTAAILNPSPAGPATLRDGAGITYTLGNAGPGGYPVIVVGDEKTAPKVIDFDTASTTILEVSVQGVRSIVDDMASGT